MRYLLILPAIFSGCLFAQCQNCEKIAGSEEVRVRGVLQKLPSTVAYINREEATENPEVTEGSEA